MKTIITFLTLLLISGAAFSQQYQGPAQGQLAAGITQSTETFDKSGPTNSKPFVFETPEVKLVAPPVLNFGKPTPPEGSNYIEDKGSSRTNINSLDTLLKSFKGSSMGNVIPPDPTVGVGPSHVVACVNTSMLIFDKEGNLLRNISGEAWIAKSVQNADVVTDPKISYDQYSKRWIMVWMTVNTATQTSFWVVSISNDSIPIGTWNTWATPSNMNGPNQVSNYSDYQGVGFDKDAIYITGNQFGFNGGFQYSKLRIYPKAQMLNKRPDPIIWSDIWDIRMPSGANTQTFGIRPTISFTESQESYLVWAYPYSSVNFVSLFKIANPISSTPSLTGVNVPCVTFSPAPNANQLGGVVTYLIESGGSNIRHEAIYRDGSIWLSHAVKNPSDTTGLNTSAVHYMKIDVASGTALEDYVFGSSGFWYFYPTIMVDKDLNMAMGFSRSGATEYIGAFYTSKKNSELTPTLSKALQTGKGNYEVTYSGTRNRWGDYMGIALDPNDMASIWMHTEYAPATNKWGSWIGRLLVQPVSGPYLTATANGYNFGLNQVGSKSDTVNLTLTNIGSQNVVITGIPSVAPFKVVNNITFPATLASFDTLNVKIVYEPIAVGVQSALLPVVSNATNFLGFYLEGSGFILASASLNTMYAITGTNQNGEVFTVNTTTGASTLIGASGFSDPKTLAIHPKTKVLYGAFSSSTGSDILGIDAVTGKAYKIFSVTVPDIKAMAFDTLGNLYASTRPGVIYKVNLSNKSIALACTSKASIVSMVFNPKDNKLWAITNTVFGVKDKIFRVNLATGDTINVGKTGTGLNGNAISFDYSGKLYLATGAVSDSTKYWLVDTATSTSVLLGTTAVKNVSGLAYSSSVVATVNVKEDNKMPSDFVLSQNYPNPFNPSTVIEYAVPQGANVQITVFNVLGEKVRELVNGYQEAGAYRVNWNASASSSGIYFYEMKASTPAGAKFVSFKKMMLIK